jgi:AcrR family transcriptional regulator
MAGDLRKPSRRERYALETKAAIVAAARKLFAEQGYFATTVEDIASEADVAPATVYSSAGGKQGLLAAILEAWRSDPVVGTTLDGVAGSNDPHEIIAVLSAAACRMRDEWGDAARIFLTTAPHDSTVAAQFAAFNVFHRQCFADVAQRLADLGALREGADAGYATDILWLYFGYGPIMVLHDDNGWSYERIRDWLAEQAARELLAEVSGKRVRP